MRNDVGSITKKNEKKFYFEIQFKLEAEQIRIKCGSCG